jgi:alanyl-tRNA synthetase
VNTTNRLYYEDCYLTSFPARIIDLADGGRRVYLESTAFYPASGGQPHDTGVLGGQTVIDVVDEGDRIAHLLDTPLEAAAVEGRIDWVRRYDHMQQHTGQHLLSAVFVELFAAHTLSFHMGPEVSSVELSLKELTDSQIDEVEHRVNTIVWQARPVNILFEAAESVQGLRKASGRTGNLRIIEISGVDRSACGGTHVRSTAELGPIQVLRWERVRGNVRAEFVCGGRALRHAKQERRILSELSKIASTATDKLPEYVSGLKDRLSETEKTQQRLTSELARREGEQIYRDTVPASDGVRRWTLQVQTIDEAARAKAQAFAKLPKALALVSGIDPAGVLVACSPDSGVNAGSLLKEALARAGGRGGGSATLAQGALPDRSVLEFLRTQLGF